MPSPNIEYGNQIVGNWDIDSDRMQLWSVAGGLRLEAPLVGELRWFQESEPCPELRLLPAEVSVTRVGKKALSLGQATLRGNGLLRGAHPRSPIDATLQLALPWPVLADLEEHREGDDLSLLFELRGEVWMRHSAARMTEALVTGASVVPRIPRSRWSDMLAANGAGGSVFVAIAKTDSFGEAVRQELLNAIRLDRLGESETRAAVAAVRLALDAFRGPPGKSALSQVPTDADDQPLREKRLLQALYHWSHLSHHADPVAAQAQWTSDRARLAITAAILLMRIV